MPDRRRALAEVAELPSETTIHFIVFCALVALAVAYVAGVPAYVLFFAEGRSGTLLYLTAALLVFAAALWARLRIRERAVAPFPTSIRSRRFRGLYEAAAAAAGLSGQVPVLLWTYDDQRTHARTIRWQGAPAVVVSAGLVQHAGTAPDDARAYLLHELAHVRNEDLRIFAWTTALTGAFRLVTLLSIVAAVTLVLIPTAIDAPSILFFDAPETPVYVFLLLMVGTLWLLSVTFTWLAIVRYAGVLISLRELYADLRALIWMEPDVYVATIRAARDRPGRSRWRSLVTPRLIHLSAAERVELLEDPVRLAAPKVRYFALVALLVLLLQSSPFTAGVDTNIMRTAPLTLWSALSMAYLLNLGRAGLARRSISKLGSPRRMIPLSLATGILFALPTLRSPQLYPSLLTIFTQPSATLAVLSGEWSQWRLVWGAGAAVLVAGGAAMTLVAWFRAGSLPRQGFDRRLIVAALLAVSLAAGIIAFRLYTSTAGTWIDPLAAFVHENLVLLAAVPAVAFAAPLLPSGSRR